MPFVKITNRYLDDVEWSPRQLCTFNRQCTEVWRINIPANLHRLDEYARFLNDDEHARANRYLHSRDKNRFIISRAVLRLLLGRYTGAAPASLKFTIGVNKKPFLHDSFIRYNVSHSGEMIVIAFSPFEVGIDLEWINPEFDYNDIIPEYFAEAEKEFIGLEDGLSRFFMFWTRKEALTKATAKGLDDDLKAIPALDGVFEVDSGMLGTSSDWALLSFKPLEGYIATIASNVTVDCCKFWDWD